MLHPEMTVTAFAADRRLATGPLREVLGPVKEAAEAGETVLVFDDQTGCVVDLDLRGSLAEAVARLGPASAEPPLAPRGRGRPKLGVVAREVTLLPRHWQWLSARPGGASVALRKLVDDARKTGGEAEARRAARETAYRFMSAIAGDLPHFEEAARALFADDADRFRTLLAAWPPDIADHANRLAFGGAASGRD